MSIRCLLIAACAVGLWGVSWAWAAEDSANTQAAEATARAEDGDADVVATDVASPENQSQTTTDGANQAERVSGDARVSPTDQASAQVTPTADEVAECCQRACKPCSCGPKECGWDFKCQPNCDYWHVSGELGAALGSSTDADNDRFEFDLREIHEDPCSHDRYEFYQRYDIDRSYVDSDTLTIGARQTIKDWRANGDLHLTEEFKRYDDKNFNSNDRQEGLFDFRWDPKWDCDRWHADISYRYNIKEYEQFSPLSYKMHRGRVRLERKVSDSFQWGVHAEVTSYNYSFGSTCDNERTEVGVDAGWHQCDVDYTASLEHEDKDFDLKKDLGYSEDRADFGVNWKIDCDSRLNARFRLTNHERPFEPDRSYDERVADATYTRQLSEDWALRVRGMVRDKAFGDPTDDMNERLGEAELTFQPTADLTWHGSLQRDVYDYADPLRAFTRDRYRLGADYYQDDLNLSAQLERQVNRYDSDPNRNWTRDTLGLDFGWHNCRNELTLHGELALLDQADTASVNDYDETQLGATWSYKIDCTTDFILSYEDRERRYDLQPAVRDRLLEARLKFDL